MTAPQPPTPRTVMTEADIQRGIRECLEALGFAVYSTAFSIRSDPGFPDVLGVSDDGLIVAVECKGPKGQIRPGQVEWLARLQRVPGCIFAGIVGPTDTAHWHSYDWSIGAIQGAAEMRRLVQEVS